MHSNEFGHKMKPAIGRAYADEPIKLFVIRELDRSADVIAEDEVEPHPIGFRREWLYRFEPKVFADLRAAYQRRDAVELRRLWASAERYS